jgi:cytochrome c
MRGSLLLVLILFGHAQYACYAAAIHDATKKGDIEAIAAALDSGADVNESDGGTTALYIATAVGNLEAVRLLIERGADVNLPAKWGTPLYAAAKFGQAEIVDLLLVSGAKPDVATRSQTALHAAADNGCFACVVHLVEAGADVNALSSERSPPIHLAKRNDHENIVQFLRDHGAEKPVVPPISARLAKADPGMGKEIFDQRCHQCHISEARGKIRNAPNLWGIVGREKASDVNFKYSHALKEEIGTWTFEALNAFISDPARITPGTLMAFAGLQNEKQRADVITYLRTLSDTPVPLPVQ